MVLSKSVTGYRCKNAFLLLSHWSALLKQEVSETNSEAKWSVKIWKIATSRVKMVAEWETSDRPDKVSESLGSLAKTQRIETKRQTARGRQETQRQRGKRKERGSWSVAWGGEAATQWHSISSVCLTRSYGMGNPLCWRHMGHVRVWMCVFMCEWRCVCGTLDSKSGCLASLWIVTGGWGSCSTWCSCCTTIVVTVLAFT